jgi:4,5-DOPA dioxygenase extradiol
MSSDLNRREVLQGVAMAPALFVSHGSPRVALETDAYPQALEALGEGLGPVRAVVQVSLPWGASAADVARMGEALRPLRSEGVVLMGSGGLTHNLRRLAWHDKSAPAETWAREFDGWLAEKLAARDFLGLQSWASAPHAQLAHPSAEHLLPLFFVLGAALPEDRLTPVFEGFHYATLSMRSFVLRG